MSKFIEVDILTNDGDHGGKIIVNIDSFDYIREETCEKNGKIVILSIKNSCSAFRCTTPIEEIRHHLGLGIH